MKLRLCDCLLGATDIGDFYKEPVTDGTHCRGSQFSDHKVIVFCETLYRHTFATIDGLRAGTVRYINFSNHQRRWAKAGNLTPKSDNGSDRSSKDGPSDLHRSTPPSTPVRRGNFD